MRNRPLLLLLFLPLMLCACDQRAPAARTFSLTSFTAAGELNWQGRAYTASLCRGEDGVLTVSVKNGLMPRPVVFCAGEESEGMELGALSLRLPNGAGAPKNVAACLREAFLSLEGAQAEQSGLWKGEGCSLSFDESGAWQTLTLSGGLLRFQHVSFAA